MDKDEKSTSILGAPAVKKLLSLFDNQNTFKLAIELRDNPSLTADEVTDLLSVSRSTAFRYLSQLESTGVVKCKWIVSRSSAPKAVKSFSLTDEGRALIELLVSEIMKKKP